MVLDFTVQMAPLFWGMVVLLLLTGAGIAASPDPRLNARYMAGPRMLVVGATLALAAVIAVVGL